MVAHGAPVAQSVSAWYLHRMVDNFTFPLIMYEGASFSLSSLLLVIDYLFLKHNLLFNSFVFNQSNACT